MNRNISIRGHTMLKELIADILYMLDARPRNNWIADGILVRHRGYYTVMVDGWTIHFFHHTLVINYWDRHMQILYTFASDTCQPIILPKAIPTQREYYTCAETARRQAISVLENVQYRLRELIDAPDKKLDVTDDENLRQMALTQWTMG